MKGYAEIRGVAAETPLLKLIRFKCKDETYHAFIDDDKDLTDNQIYDIGCAIYFATDKRMPPEYIFNINASLTFFNDALFSGMLDL